MNNDTSIKDILLENFLTYVKIWTTSDSQKADEGIYGKSITDPCLGWEKTEKLIDEIVIANRSQDEATETIRTTVNNLSNAVQQNASFSEELSAMSEELTAGKLVPVHLLIMSDKNRSV